MKKPRVYLSGGMQYARKGGGPWRKDLGLWLRNELGHVILDPVIASEKILANLRLRGWNLKGVHRLGGDWQKFFRRIVDRDIRLVRSSTYVICYWNAGARKGAGTQGELTVAREARIPVYLVSRTSKERLPGWIQGCITEHFSGFEALKTFLKHRYS